MTTMIVKLLVLNSDIEKSRAPSHLVKLVKGLLELCILEQVQLCVFHLGVTLPSHTSLIATPHTFIFKFKLYGILFNVQKVTWAYSTAHKKRGQTRNWPGTIFASLLNHLLSRWRQFSDPTVTLFQLTFPPWSNPDALSKHNTLSSEVIILQPWVYQISRQIENIPDFQKDSRLILKIWDKLEIFQRFLKHLKVIIHTVGLVMLRYECFPLWDTDKAIKNLSSWHIGWNVKRHTKRTNKVFLLNSFVQMSPCTGAT